MRYVYHFTGTENIYAVGFTCLDNALQLLDDNVFTTPFVLCYKEIHEMC